MSIFETLVTDRSAADPEELRALLVKAVEGTATGEEWAVLNDPGHRGAYNYTDLNRVTAAMDDLHGRLTAYGYRTGYEPLRIDGGRTEWREEDVPTREQLEHYLANLRALKGVLNLRAATPQAPEDMEGLTYGEANDIERILTDLDFQVVTMATTFIPCGEALCGGDNL